jgi:4-hydroxy-4-methyl-2-oxoglutarate aldolase
MPMCAEVGDVAFGDAAPIVERSLGYGVATLHEAAGRRGLVHAIRLLVGPAFAGPAATVAIPAGDNLGIHVLLAEAPAGSVACVASAGQGRYGVVGELIVEAARAAGIAGLVLDDGIRDAELLAAPPSIAARGIVANGTVKRRHLGLGVPVALGGVLVRPGDWVVVDTDGACVIPADRLPAVLSAAEARVRKEDTIRDALRAGETTITVLGLGTLLSDMEVRST